MAPRSTNTAGTDKSKVKRAPQKRVLHIFYKLKTNEDGSPGIEVVNVMSDARKVLEYVDRPEYSQEGIKRYKHEVVSTQRDDGTEEETHGAAADQSGV